MQRGSTFGLVFSVCLASLQIGCGGKQSLGSLPKDGAASALDGNNAFVDATPRAGDGGLTADASATGQADASAAGQADAGAAGQADAGQVLDSGADSAETVSSDPALLGFSIVGHQPLMRPAETTQLQLWSYYSNGQTLTRTGALWASDNPAVLSVSSSGFSEAVAAGTSTVSAALDGKVVATVLITVRNVTLQSLSIGPANLTIPFPASLNVTATGVYSDGSMFDLTGTRTVEWESDPDLSFDASAFSGTTVSAVGRVGTFQISATFEGVTASAAVSVPFGTPNSIRIQDPPELPVGFPYPIVAVALYGDDTLDVTSLVTWSVEDPTILTLGADAVVHPLKPGTTQVRASYPGFTIAPLPLTVNTAVLRAIDVSPSDFTMYVGDSPQSFQAYGTLDNGQIFEVTARAVWATANPQIATVSNAAGAIGLVTPVKVGSTVLRATIGNITGSTTVTIDPHDL